MAREDRKTTKQITGKSLEKAEDIVRRREQAATDERTKAEAEKERKRLEEVARRIAENDRKAIEAAKKAKDAELRKQLLTAAIAHEYTKDLQKREKRATLRLAELAQMAAVTMQAATAMNSVDQSQPLVTAKSAPTAKAQPGLSNRSPASLGDKQADISQKSAEELAADAAADAESTAKAEKDQKTKGQIKEAIEAAEKRKAILALRLKNKLREKAKLAKGEKKEGLDTSELFGGSLTSELANDPDVETESTTNPEDITFASSVFSAVKGGFSLAGAETDREVKEIVDGVQRELSSEEMSAGVLGEESPSLFERVHSVHQNCLRQKCVFSASASSSKR